MRFTYVESFLAYDVSQISNQHLTDFKQLAMQAIKNMKPYTKQRQNKIHADLLNKITKIIGFDAFFKKFLTCQTQHVALQTYLHILQVYLDVTYIFSFIFSILVHKYLYVSHLYAILRKQWQVPKTLKQGIMIRIR